MDRSTGIAFRHGRSHSGIRDRRRRSCRRSITMLWPSSRHEAADTDLYCTRPLPIKMRCLRNRAVNGTTSTTTDRVHCRCRISWSAINVAARCFPCFWRLCALNNRFAGIWCPGSSIAGIMLALLWPHRFHRCRTVTCVATHNLIQHIVALRPMSGICIGTLCIV
mmetsp:Transcript_34732/g.110426  ORF Transcript_34732/g.110426 Transcript_34732/m.110426 type:complete len:165 (-) Transcript_34732:36-530(-)